MPIANITIDTTKRLGQDLRQLVTCVFAARDISRRLKETMDQHTDGTTWTTLEAQFGLQAGQGQNTYNLVAALTGVSGALEAAAVTQLCDRLG